MIKDAEDGSVTYTINGMESFGPNTSSAVANDQFVMLFDTPNDEVIAAFRSVDL